MKKPCGLLSLSNLSLRNTAYAFLRLLTCAALSIPSWNQFPCDAAPELTYTNAGGSLPQLHSKDF
ncbi:MAG: hypothetical protein RLZZ214_797 [Verrucomicrobiota bacterium]|jgi:hypothetical protein